MRQRRCSGEGGVTLVIMALTALGLIGVAGLAIDGGRVVGERRAMQNASDSAAMAGTRQLDLFLTGQIPGDDASKIREAVIDSATKNGADPAVLTCDLVTFDRVVLGPCPTGTTMNPGFQAVVAGVKVGTSNTRDTFLMQAWGARTFTAVADATAQIGRPGGPYVAPFVVCATAPGNSPPLLIPDATSATGFAVNELAIGNEYIIYGNAIKQDGRDCGNPSESFRGNVNLDSDYPMPGDWDTDTGNANGPTVRLVNSGGACASDWVVGCRVILPLCPSGNGQTGTNYRAYCVDLGLFDISFVELTGIPEIRAIFRGRATINQGGIVGPADPNGARIVALTD